MNTQLTEIAYILDRSASMQGLEEAAITGFNNLLQEQREAPGHANLTLILFDNAYLTPHQRAPLAQIPELTAATYIPRGSTALLDAIGRTIDDLGKQLDALPEAERPGHVILAIFTDGYENTSQTYSLPDIEQRITHQRRHYNWEFLFLAANQDAIATATATSMGIDRHSASQVDYCTTGIRRSYKTSSASITKSRQMLQEQGQVDPDSKPSLSEEYQATELK